MRASYHVGDANSTCICDFLYSLHSEGRNLTLTTNAHDYGNISHETVPLDNTGFMVPLDLGLPGDENREAAAIAEFKRRHAPRKRGTIIQLKHLPGPLAMRKLTKLQAVMQLDSAHSVNAEMTRTLYGRATVMHELIPQHTAACERTAAWVWLGGALPEDYFEVLSTSHYRRVVYGRHIRVRQRRVNDDHMSVVGKIRLTNPVRTACDLALYSPKDPHFYVAQDLISQLMEQFRFTTVDCEPVLEHYAHLRGSAQARDLLVRFESIA